MLIYLFALFFLNVQLYSSSETGSHYINNNNNAQFTDSEAGSLKFQLTERKSCHQEGQDESSEYLLDTASNTDFI